LGVIGEFGEIEEMGWDSDLGDLGGLKWVLMVILCVMGGKPGVVQSRWWMCGGDGYDGGGKVGVYGD
jgi:hypothetical protein